jgi:hypothetical protein
VGQEAKAILRCYDNDRDAVLIDCDWPFASQYFELGEPVLGGDEDGEPANGDWLFAYEYPDEALAIRRFVTPLGRREPNPPPFMIGSDEGSKVIFTNVPEECANVEITRAIEDEEEFPALFCLVLSWKIAASIAASQSQIKDMAASAFQRYLFEKASAQAVLRNEGRKHDDPETPSVSARY